MDLECTQYLQVYFADNVFCAWIHIVFVKVCERLPKGDYFFPCAQGGSLWLSC